MSTEDDKEMNFDFPMRFFDDDGNEVNLDLFPKPSLCLTCINDHDPREKLVCNLTRLDQRHEKEFICFAYKKK